MRTDNPSTERYENLYGVEVQTVSCAPDAWTGNAVQFGDIETAKAYALDLFSRWHAVTKWRVVDKRTGEVVA